MLGTFVIYLTAMFVCVGLSYWSKKKKTKIGIFAAYLILILLSVLRFDIGNDYGGYVDVINSNATSFRLGNSAPLFSISSVEPLMYVLTYVFRNMSHPYIWVLGIHSIIIIIFLYKAFKDNDCHGTGIMILFISEMLFVNWDQARQGVAIAIFIYAIKFIKEKNLPKYILFILLAATAHYSVLLLLPFYFVNKIKTRKYFYILIIMVLAILNSSIHYFDSFINLISILPEHFDTKDTSHALVQINSMGYKMRTFFYCLMWCTTIFFLSEKERVLSNLLFIGAIIFIFASGALNITRFSFYFTFTMVISIPLVFKIQKAKMIMRILVIGFFLFFIRDIITNTNTWGCVPYESIFSNNFTEQIYRQE